jgi:alkylation response protein AidB-like acyl-CoA dehydrogenase
MDLSFTSEQEQFRAKIQKFLVENLPPGWGKAGFRPDGMSMIEFMRDWQRRLYEGGFLGMAWPREFGGQGASQIEMAIFNEEVARVRAPAPLNVLGLTMAAPTIITYAPTNRKSGTCPKF